MRLRAKLSTIKERHKAIGIKRKALRHYALGKGKMQMVDYIPDA